MGNQGLVVDMYILHDLLMFPEGRYEFEKHIVSILFKVLESLATSRSDRQGLWTKCKSNHALCNGNQIQFLQGKILIGVLLNATILSQLKLYIDPYG